VSLKMRRSDALAILPSTTIPPMKPKTIPISVAPMMDYTDTKNT
jgi:hypothetical protein